MATVILSIVVPAHNEENSIEDIISRIKKQADAIRNAGNNDVEIIIVNDASKDSTLSKAQKMSGIKVIDFKKNRGYGGALKGGFEQAQGTYVAFLDADGTYPPESLPKMLAVAQEHDADMIVGSRFGSEKREMPFLRFVGNRLYAMLLSWLVRQKVSDVTTGLRILKKSSLFKLYPLPDGLDFTSAMSTAALHEDMNIIEVDIPYAKRTGSSKLSILNDGVRFLKTILNLSRLYDPSRLLNGIGVLMFIAGILLGIKPFMLFLATKNLEYGQFYRLFTIMVLFITGVNVIAFGAFSNHVLAITYGKKAKAEGFLAKYIITERILHYSGLIGFTLIVLALLLNVQTIYEYIMTQKIYVHWFFILTGATSFLIGAQLMMTRFLLDILKQLEERREQNAQ